MFSYASSFLASLTTRVYPGTTSESSSSDDASPESFDTDPILALLAQYPPAADASAASDALTKEELLNIGLQAAQLIADAAASADDSVGPLSTLKQLAQNFPRYAASLARRVTVTDGLAAEVTKNHAKAQGGVSMAWLNGAVVGEGNSDAFS